jgi:hypothetical protein
MLYKFIFDNYKNDNALKEKLIKIEEKIAIIQNQKDEISIIDKT